jgi:hypothetical protein
MRKRILRLTFLSCLAFAGVSEAAIGTIDLSWDGCTGPVDKTTTTPGVYSLFITEVGQDQAARAYDVRLVYGNATQEVPDAWRFDAEGCETGAAIQLDFASKVCPSFAQETDSSATIRVVGFVPPSDPYATTLMRILFAHAYAPGNPVEPATRHLLERIQFDMNDAVVGAGTATTCGGFEQAICFALTYATFLDLDRNEVPFNRARTPLTVSFDGPIATCPGVVPVRAETWGSIKSQYRQ